VFAIVNWYKEHPNKEFFGNPVEVWKGKDFVDGGNASFMPVQRICGKFAAVSQVISGFDSLVVCPIPYKVYI
jgi:hypothetical protein